VSLTNERGEGNLVSNVDKASWNEHWRTRDREFEAF
jgi:hypothetical protein